MCMYLCFLNDNCSCVSGHTPTAGATYLSHAGKESSCHKGTPGEGALYIGGGFTDHARVRITRKTKTARGCMFQEWWSLILWHGITYCRVRNPRCSLTFKALNFSIKNSPLSDSFECYGSTAIRNILLSLCRDRLSESSEPDVYRCQIFSVL